MASAPEAAGGADDAGAGRRIALALGGVLLVFFLLLYLRVKATNFGGFDEWVYLTLGSRGVLGFPHTNRPFTLAWTLPALWIAPDSFQGYYWLHFGYLLAAAALVFRLARLVAPRDELLAFLAAAFSLVWAPDALWRLDTVMSSMSTGVVAGALLAALLFASAWERRSTPLAALAGGLAFVVIRSYEGMLPLLAAAPLPLAWRDRRGGLGARVALLAVYGAAVAWAAGLALWPALSGGSTYQLQYFEFDPRPQAVLGRLAEQLGRHVPPLVSPPPAGAERALAAVAVLLVGCFAARGGSSTRGEQARVAALGLAMAALLYLPFVFSDMWGGAGNRAQTFGAPGIGLALAAGVRAAGGGRAWPSALLAAWVAYVGGGHMLRLQDHWDATSFHPKQRRTLLGLTREVPDVRPGTLIALLDTTWAWPAVFPFHHAVGYLYGGRAAGYVAGVEQPLYLMRFDPDGVRVEPHEVLRGPWRVEPRTYRYDEVVVAVTAPGGVRVLLEWPAAGLPPLPEGARYDPLPRIVPLREPSPQRRVLGES